MKSVAGTLKLELAQYYATLGERFVGEVRGRPLVLVRCPGGDFGQCFFQRHASAGLDVENIAPRRGAENVIVLQTLPAAVSCVQNGTIEFHTWGATIPNLAQPDRFVLDLDPDPALPWAKVREGCELVRAVLDHLELEWFVKTTGGKGLHFVVPLVRRHTWDEVKDFTGAIAQHLARTLPSLFTATMSKARRAQRIYVDYLRNAEQASAVAAYSARARAGLPVSTPIDWAELARDVRGAHFNVRNVPQRLAKQKRDPWSAYARSAQRISAAMRRALEP
jgi:bifunctional non-homologous end joining protein LigD